jgi:hypothetical protein
MLAGSRNKQGLTTTQVARCQAAWELICEGESIPLDISEAHRAKSRTRFHENRNRVYLGADSYPGDAPDANSRMSMLACLAHERAHYERYRAGYRRPVVLPDALLDEAETSLRAAFHPSISNQDKIHLAEDARDRINGWISEGLKNDENTPDSWE